MLVVMMSSDVVMYCIVKRGGVVVDVGVVVSNDKNNTCNIRIDAIPMNTRSNTETCTRNINNTNNGIYMISTATLQIP